MDYCSTTESTKKQINNKIEPKKLATERPVEKGGAGPEGVGAAGGTSQWGMGAAWQVGGWSSGDAARWPESCRGFCRVPQPSFSNSPPPPPRVSRFRAHPLPRPLPVPRPRARYVFIPSILVWRCWRGVCGCIAIEPTGYTLNFVQVWGTTMYITPVSPVHTADGINPTTM